MMFGYATNETDDYMPLALDVSHKLLQELAVLRRENDQINLLRADVKRLQPFRQMSMRVR